MKISTTIVQLLKFTVVGVSNTLITALVIWVLLKVLNYSDYTANVIGYFVGLLNSFIWNRKWTFNSSNQLSKTVLKFMITFVISYLLQLANLFLLINYTTFDPYISQLLSMVVYTTVNFILNKYYTFKTNNK